MELLDSVGEGGSHDLRLNTLEVWGDHFKVEEDSEINVKGNGS